MPLDEALFFALIGKNLGTRRSLANDVYYDPENDWRKLFERRIVTAATKT